MSRGALQLAVALLLVSNLAGGIVLAAQVAPDRGGCCADESTHESPCPSSPACDCCLHAAPLPPLVVSIGLAACGVPLCEGVPSEAEGTSADVFHVPLASR